MVNAIRLAWRRIAVVLLVSTAALPALAWAASQLIGDEVLRSGMQAAGDQKLGLGPSSDLHRALFKTRAVDNIDDRVAILIEHNLAWNENAVGDFLNSDPATGAHARTDVRVAL